MKLCLFDIDGTLIYTNGAGRAALARALDSVFEMRGSLDNIRLDGKTDLLLIREVLVSRGRSPDFTMSGLVFSQYVEYLKEEISTRREAYRVLPGVLELLERLREEPNVLTGLATGNIETGARVKLEFGQLNPFFPFGGFGSDSESRTELIRAGIQRARKLCGTDIQSTIVIGDTPQDIAHGQAAGARVVAVASGFYSVDELRALGPDLAVPSLAPVGPVLDFILSC